MLQAGDLAPAFTLKDLFGASVTSADLGSDTYVLVFFKGSCPTCQFAMPFVQRIAEGSTRIFAVSQDDASSTRKFMKQFGLRLPVFLDSSKDRYPASNGFKIDHVPTFFGIAPDGHVEFSFTGFVKTELEGLGRAAGVETFRTDETVPAMKPG